MLPISFIMADVKLIQKGSAMKKIIGVVLVGVCVLLMGCGQSAQEKKQQEKQHIMGDGDKKVEPLKPGETVGGL